MLFSLSCMLRHVAMVAYVWCYIYGPPITGVVWTSRNDLLTTIQPNPCGVLSAIVQVIHSLVERQLLIQLTTLGEFFKEGQPPLWLSIIPRINRV